MGSQILSHQVVSNVDAALVIAQVADELAAYGHLPVLWPVTISEQRVLFGPGYVIGTEAVRVVAAWAKAFGSHVTVTYNGYVKAAVPFGAGTAVIEYYHGSQQAGLLIAELSKSGVRLSGSQARVSPEALLAVLDADRSVVA